MFSVGFFKGQPNEYILKYVNGRVRKEGPGLAFYYLPHNTQVVAVPTSSMDAPFIFNEVTNNFQSVTIQGQCTYRIANPRQAASLLNFTMNPFNRAYVSEDPDRLAKRITNVIQMETRSEIQKRSLEETLGQSEAIAAAVFAHLRDDALLAPLGVELLSLFFVAAKPTPEVAKALEATYRETLLRKADEAVYARRAAAVEEERKIKENELSTDITLEQQRQKLIELQGTNAQQEAEFRGQAMEQEAAHRARATEMEMAIYHTFAPPAILALAMKELGQNADRIGNLTITSEILAALLNAPIGTPSNE
ncbi:MAG: SPFH domain-containing protein [Abitibacteriaceae bacterium]|nr:SPFH domain-containing protein [Abditibacteriaceae bacterium]MBV9865143.1 SPFH domain-containing protein [Abditibacteriaceae bacterium]